MKQPPVSNEVILASAGSGKTFKLSDRIIKLLANGAQPQEIVALTFTRAAAAEFIAKTLAKLAEAAKNELAAAELTSRLELKPSCDATFYRELLRSTLLSMHRLTLGTLDSFFARLVVNNPAEVGLDGGEIRAMGDIEQAQVRREVITQMMTETPEEEIGALWADLRDINEGKDVAVPLETFEQKVKALHDLLTLAPEAHLWGQATSIWGGLPKAFSIPAEAEVVTAEETISSWLEGQSFHATFRRSLTDLAKGIRQMTNVGELKPNAWKLLAERLSPVILSADGVKVNVEYPSGEKPKTIELTVEFGDAFRLLARKAYGIAIDVKLRQTQALHRLLSRYEEIYQRNVRRVGQLTFSDNVSLLLEAEKRGTKLNIDYRLDCSVKHWLFDEFQDTSTRQWKVLANNLNEVATAEADEWRTTFFVGDLKQSLYGWRGGNPELLRAINADPVRTGGKTDNRMDYTRRCAQPIVDLVNALLGNLAPRGPFFSVEAAAKWQTVFHAHESKAKDKTLGEALWVRLNGVVEGADTDDVSGEAEAAVTVNDSADEPGEEEGDEIEIQARWIGQHIKASELTNGRLLKPGITCAVLVSTNQQAAKITETLRKNGVEAADEANAEVAMDNPFTAGFVALVANAAYPSDQYHQGLAGMAPAARAYAVKCGGWAEARLRMAEVFQQGGAEALVQDFLKDIDLTGAENAQAFLRKRTQQILTLAVNFDQDSPRQLVAFSHYLSTSTLRDTADPRAVQVLTIHRSKGLQYTAVYLPGMNNDRRKIAGIRPDDPMLSVDGSTFDPEWILVRPKTEASNRDEIQLGRIAVEEKAAAAFENLCKLYVGMTRAIRRLVIISEPLSTKAQDGLHDAKLHGKYDYAMLLEAVLNPDAKHGEDLLIPDAPSANIVWKAGDSSWLNFITPPSTEQTQAQIRDLSRLPALSRIERLRPSKSGPIFQGQWKPQQGEARGKIFGTLVHELCQHLEWDQADYITKLRAQTWPVTDPENSAEAIVSIERCLAAPAVAALLSTHTADTLLWREKQAVLMHEGQLISAVFDRVHVIPGQAAVVIDYKTNDCTVEHLKGIYQGQMDLYRIAVAKLCGLSPEKVRCVLVHVRAGAVIET